MDEPTPDSASQEPYIGVSSPSVLETAGSLSDREDVFAWEIIQQLVRLHPEYGDKHAEELVSATGPTGSTTKPVTHWLGLVRAAFHPSVHATLHGRLVILGLSAMHRELAGMLDKFGVLRRLREEVEELLTFTQRFLSAAQQVGNVDWLIEFGLLDQDTEIPESAYEGETTREAAESAPQAPKWLRASRRRSSAPSNRQAKRIGPDPQLPYAAQASRRAFTSASAVTSEPPGVGRSVSPPG